MRVTAVDMYSPTLEEAISFSLLGADPRAEYEVRTILGLDAEEIIPKFYGSSINGDDKFYNFTMKPRNIIIRVVLKPRFHLEETFADVRDRLYRTISSNRTGLMTLHFKAGATTIAQIMGKVVKFEAVHFTKLPEVQITLKCDDPVFKAINPVIYEASELPATNPVNVPDSLSTAPHGIFVQVTFTASSPSFIIQDDDVDPTWMFKVTPSGGFLSGDVLYISSEYSNRMVYMVRSSTVIQLADKIDVSSVWPVVFHGSNPLYFLDIDDFDWNEISYYASYWGV